MHKVAVIVGSIRKDSINKKLATALEKLGAGKLEFQRIRIDDLPLFNQDDEASPPPEVVRMKGEIKAADAVLFVTPEHNRSIPAAMKNAFDWGPAPRQERLDRQSGGGDRDVRRLDRHGGRAAAPAHEHRRHFIATLGSPEAYVVFSDGLIDDEGNVTKDETRKFLQGFVDKFARLIAAVKP